jgi:hypothetical protein
LVFGLVRKLQGTEAKVSGLDVLKNISAQVSPDSFMSFDVNKKVMLIMCFSCFFDPILKDTTKTELILTVLPCSNGTLTNNTWHTFSDQMLSVNKLFIKSRSDLQ